eukprot:1159500-Pelagomonas_calceolata.AAC.19
MVQWLQEQKRSEEKSLRSAAVALRSSSCYLSLSGMGPLSLRGQMGFQQDGKNARDTCNEHASPRFLDSFIIYRHCNQSRLCQTTHGAVKDLQQNPFSMAIHSALLMDILCTFIPANLDQKLQHLP